MPLLQSALNPLLKLIKLPYKFIVPLKWRIAIIEYTPTLKTNLVFAAAKLIFFVSHPRCWMFWQRKTIFCWPNRPQKKDYVFFKIVFLWGYSLTTDPAADFNLMIDWEDVTHRRRDPGYLAAVHSLKCVNKGCLNIGKENTDRIFEEVFGYPLAVDPRAFHGHAVKKSKVNASHSGEVVSLPIPAPQGDWVYQKLINNEFNSGSVYDMRVPIFEKEIPFVYYKYRNKDDRFDHYTKADVIKDVQEALSNDEIAKILAFTEKIGLQYGELDVLRDKDDGRIYIVDANNTPCGPRWDRMAFKDYIFAVFTLAETFDRTFMRPSPRSSIPPQNQEKIKFCPRSTNWKP